MIKTGENDIRLAHMPLLLTLLHLFLEELHFTGTSLKARNKLHKRAQSRNVFSKMRNIKGEAHLHNFLDQIAPIGGTHTRSRIDLCKMVAMGAHLGVHPYY
jgi:hypothetical protein